MGSNNCVYRKGISKTGQFTKPYHEKKKNSKSYPVSPDVLKNQPASCCSYEKCKNTQKRKFQCSPLCGQNRQKGNDPRRSSILQLKVFCYINSQTGSYCDFYRQQ